MSIQEKNVETVVAEPVVAVVPPISLKHWYTVFRSPLWLCLLIALLLRIWLTYHTRGIIDGDEAIVGIQAEHILRGEHPIYFYGQSYMGSLEAYLIALIFAIVGPSVWAMRAEPILLSLAVVALTWKFAAILAEGAHLPPFASQMFKTLAALFAAIPPLYDTVLELRTLGGYIETFVLMLLLLISAYQLTRRWHAGASKPELALRWAGIGFIVGFGFWIDPLIASAVAASAIWILIFCITEPIRLFRQKPANSQPRRTPFTFLQEFLLVLLAIPTGILGLIPALHWGSYYNWANFTYIFQLNDMKSLSLPLQLRYHSRWDIIHDQTYLYTQYVAPRVIGGSLPTESSLLTAIHFWTLWFGLACIAISLLLVTLSLFWHHPYLVRIRQLGALPLLFAICTAITFCTSMAASIGLISFQNDIAGRYATPLMLALPFLFAMPFTLLSLALYRFAQHRRHHQRHQRQQPSQAISQPSTSHSASRIIPLIAQVCLGILLFAYFGAQISTYTLTNSDTTYQSPSCPIAPANNDPIIAYLQQQHVHYAWAIPWIGNPIIFKTNNNIIMADPRPILFHNGWGRIPSYSRAVLHADRPAMLVFVSTHDTHPLLLQTLDALHVTYKTARFPSEPGTDVLVVTSLSRTVSLFESTAFRSIFPGCI